MLVKENKNTLLIDVQRETKLTLLREELIILILTSSKIKETETKVFSVLDIVYTKKQVDSKIISIVEKEIDESILNSVKDSLIKISKEETSLLKYLYEVKLDLQIIEEKEKNDVMLNIGTLNISVDFDNKENNGINTISTKVILQIVKEKNTYYKHIAIN